MKALQSGLPYLYGIEKLGATSEYLPLLSFNKADQNACLN